MWISKEHFELIRERAREFRAWHEERMREKDAQIRSQESRLAVLELERKELTERLWTRQQEREKPPAPIQDDGPDDWVAEMRRQAEQAMEFAVGEKKSPL